jgi:excisionase family DNA binding protein
MPDTYPRLLTLLELAAVLRISPHTVRAMCRKGRLRPVRICRRLLFSTDEIDRLLQGAKHDSFQDSNE